MGGLFVLAGYLLVLMGMAFPSDGVLEAAAEIWNFHQEFGLC